MRTESKADPLWPELPSGYTRNFLATLAMVPHSSLTYWISTGKVLAPRHRFAGVKSPRYNAADFSAACEQIDEIKRSSRSRAR